MRSALIMLSMAVLPGLMACSPGVEEDPCVKLWNVAAADPGATWQIEGGKLSVAVDQPSRQDGFRIFHNHDEYKDPSGKGFSVAVDFHSFEATGFDGAITAWVAYEYAPDVPVFSIEFNKGSTIATFPGSYRQQFHPQTGTSSGTLTMGYSAHDKKIRFTGPNLNYAIDQDFLEPDPLVFYVDVGSPEPVMGQRSDKVAVVISDIEFKYNGPFLITVDDFDCNSLEE